MTGLIREMTQDWLGRAILAFAAFIVGFLLALPFLFYQWAAEQKEWEAFSAEHDCRVVSVVLGPTILMPMTVGKSIVLMPQKQPDRATYLCNDERTYVRRQTALDVAP